MSTPTFSKANPQEAEEISRFVNNAYRGVESKKGWTTEEHLLGGQRTDREDILDKINGSFEGIFLLKKGKELLGSVYLKKKSDEIAYLGMLSVNPDAQSKGIGKELLIQSETFIKTIWKCIKIQMSVIEQREELIAYYIRRGYNKTGEIEPFPMNDVRFGIPKVPFIQMVILEKRLS